MDAWQRAGFVLVSLVIVVILGAQTAASFGGAGADSWPMTSYPMYSSAHAEGERLDHDFRAYARLDDGRRVEITRRDLGMDFWTFYKTVAKPVIAGEAAATVPLLERFCDANGGRIVAIEVDDLGVTLRYEGPLEGPPATAGAIAVSCSS